MRDVDWSSTHPYHHDPVFSMTGEERKSLLREFELKTKFGTDGFGRVISFKSSSLNRFFAATKFLQSDIHRNEKAVLKKVDPHPFLVTLFWTHEYGKFFYLLFEHVPDGGDLFSRLKRKGHFENKTALFYSCEIVCALEYLHKKSIVYRNLNPKNILIGKDGHIKLKDMSVAKTFFSDICETFEYLAPEVNII